MITKMTFTERADWRGVKLWFGEADVIGMPAMGFANRGECEQWVQARRFSNPVDVRFNSLAAQGLRAMVKLLPERMLTNAEIDAALG